MLRVCSSEIRKQTPYIFKKNCEPTCVYSYSLRGNIGVISYFR